MHKYICIYFAKKKIGTSHHVLTERTKIILWWEDMAREHENLVLICHCKIMDSKSINFTLFENK